MALAAMGVVFGDIGTSPLYAFREALRPISQNGLVRTEVIGLISLMIWTLTIIVMLKYILFLLRLDNDGEGGTLSLLEAAREHWNGNWAGKLFYHINIFTTAIVAFARIAFCIFVGQF